MHSKMLLIASFATATLAASKYPNGLWINEAGVCAETYTTSDGKTAMQCMGSKYAQRGDASVCYKNNYECQISGCGATLHDSKGDALPACPVKETSGSGSSLFPAPSPASGGMRATVITNPMRGWMDMKESQFANFPPTVVGRDALVPTVHTEAGYKMILQCTDGYGGIGGYCDHFVFLYSCPPCQYADGGNLAASLLAEGWAPHRCEATFQFDINYGSALHEFVIYHKQTLQGNEDLIVPADELDFVFYANTPATSYCPGKTNEADCNANIPAECAWKDGSCQANLCPKPQNPPRGPWQPKPRCKVCTSDADETKYVPPRA